mgnify:CR=1 FL=1
MKYRPLGKTELQVPLIGLGTMTWGEQNNLQQACEQMDYALSRGVNLFDVAEMYPVPPRPETVGATERCVGEWLAQTGKRAEVILAAALGARAARGAARRDPRPEHRSAIAALVRDCHARLYPYVPRASSTPWAAAIASRHHGTPRRPPSWRQHRPKYFPKEPPDDPPTRKKTFK